MRVLLALVAVLALLGVVYLGVAVAGQHYLFGVVIPYLAVAVFLVGLVYRVYRWAKAPVPFRITTVCGQQKTLDWLPAQRWESPAGTLDVIVRMALEVLLFRSLFRNTKMEINPSNRVVHQSEKLLWAGGLVFHWCFLVILLRHMRYFLEPTPGAIKILEFWDGFFQLAVPTLFVTDLAIVGALLFLLARRLMDAQVRYISLPSDYFALFLLLGVVLSGVSMRYLTKVDLVAVKGLTMSLVEFQPSLSVGIGMPFFIHLFLLSALLFYFPFSKLVHMGGVFLSPTRNMANDNRARRHVNPWNAPVEVHTYAQWQHEFRDKLESSGIPIDEDVSHG